MKRLLRTTAVAAVLFALGGCQSESGAPQEAEDIAIVLADVPNLSEDVSPTVDVPTPLDVPEDVGTIEDILPDVGPGPLVVTEVLPPHGRPAGNQSVAVLGADFHDGCSVLFDGVEGEFPIFVTDERLHVNTPPHQPDVVDVTVICGERVGVLADGFTYFNEVTVDSVTPPVGSKSGATPITVRGRGFQPGSLLVIGANKALDTVVVDETTLIALTPPGPAGPASVTVSNERGVGNLNGGFTYQAGASIDLVLPPVGPLAGGNTVELRGSGLSTPLGVWFGPKPATDVTVVEIDGVSAVRVTAPSGTAGAVDVLFEGSEGTAIAEYTYVDQPDSLHLYPARGPSTGGIHVAIAVPGLSTFDVDNETFTVAFGATPAAVLEIAGGTVIVVSPPGAVGAASVEVTLGGEAFEGSYEYVMPLVISEVSPAAGPVEGGTTVTVTGTGFVSPMTAFVGAKAAVAVEVVDSGTLVLTVPAAPPGLVDVRVVRGLDEAIAEGAFEYTTAVRQLWVVLPDRGAIAGNTWVQMIGAGFKPEDTVRFGELDGLDVTWQSPGLITVRTPPAAKGPVSVTIDGVGDATTLEHAFTYFDPKTTFGGTAGGPMNGSVNVTVLDGLTAQPVPEAFVLVGSDGATNHQGLTNDDGQVTLSGPDLFGSRELSISKEGYVTYSVVHFNADSVTVFLKQLAQPEPALPTAALPGLINGKVIGLGKYTTVVPGTCQPNELDPIHCQPCFDPSDCAGETTEAGICTDLGVGQGARCLMPCEAPGDCPSAHHCSAFSTGKACLPLPGEPVSVCTGSKPGYRIADVPIGVNAMADEDGEFSILTWPTEIAVVCFGGFWIGNGEPTSAGLEDAIKGNPSGKFQPVVMGVARNLLMGSAVIKSGIEVEMTIPLNRSVRARMEKPPLDDADYLWAQAYLDFGSDGVVRMPVIEFLYADEPFVLEALPTSLSNIEGASYIFYAGARAYSNASGYGYPRSYVVRSGVTEPQDDRMLRLVDGAWETPNTGLVESFLGAHLVSPGLVMAVGTGGSTFKYQNGQHSSLPSPTNRTLRAVHGVSADAVFAVGDDGIVIEHDGQIWTKLVSPTAFDLRAVRAEADGSLRVAGVTGLWERIAVESEWSKPVNGGSWNTIGGTSSADLWLGGTFGNLQRRTGTGWSTVSTPGVASLRGIAARATDDVWFVGDEGTILHFDGATIQAVASSTTEHLYSLAVRPGSDELVATGAYGTVLLRDAGVWSTAPNPGYVQDLHAAVLPEGTADIHTFGDHQLILGPIAAPARISVPLANNTLDTSVDTPQIQWSADPRVTPHYQLVEIYVPGLLAPTLIWELMVDGDVDVADLPDLLTISGNTGLQEGLHHLGITRVYQPGFDIDNFDYSLLGNIDRESWSIEFIDFLVPASDEPEP